MLQHQFQVELQALEASQKAARQAAHVKIQTAFEAMDGSLGQHVDGAMDHIIATQQAIQDACIQLGKVQVQRHQKVVRWKAELRRFQAQVDDLKLFEQWCERTEANLHLVCGKLEYVCHELNRLDDDTSTS
ncbi:hypothetical protein H257_07467 [Aphanomyces astaci]|uniref:Uncharacterized protein n=1 Tax=Aphanomyces astaci TaxID=112090 RepID=W4GJF5_APHAT|nr:hypothetical protein H257_07467 [Aphanomyces astaci]ETV79466.1 hypothetical protein H257_07467 [Aphanomyces astaci]RHY08338.1 hypothetical protein DYB25_003478 [Aphanomyces astaci]RHY13257.1 hypothetical protein DYB36_004355 [Aphanomyces astaci]RHY51244.1 hypothetical protein DYB38_004239 [Aphanomyces astaci]RHY54952.1 hypothetical protein DYB34_004101 [Aphanomyces astaci]|eukprot:XP_009831307.1 hypothetical protein H257_07467 [Aphanomyces astaci]